MAEGGLLPAGRVGAAHGLDGSFHVVGAKADLLKLAAPVRIGDRDFTIDRRAGHDRRLILRVAGVSHRDGALALRGLELFVPRSQAPALGADEWWAEDLEGCRVTDGERVVGTVVRLLGLPSCEVLEVERGSGGALLLVPLVSDAVRSVDVVTRQIDVNLTFLGED